MKFYTQDEFNSINNTAKDFFKKESDKKLKFFSQFLKKLEADTIEPSEKVKNAFLEKEKIEYELEKFIYVNYPKTEEIFINGLVQYTAETAIFYNLMVVFFGKTCKELECLYQDFFEKNFPQG